MFRTLWAPLALTPLLWLTLTLAAFAFGQAVQRLCRRSPLANPVLIAILVMVAILKCTNTSYAEYFAGAQFIHFLLGPATVALAVPLALNLNHIRRSLHGLGLALLAGSLTSTISGVAVVWAMGGGWWCARAHRGADNRRRHYCCGDRSKGLALVSRG
jgi:putative effector of murein hydrolase